MVSDTGNHRGFAGRIRRHGRYRRHGFGQFGDLQRDDYTYDTSIAAPTVTGVSPNSGTAAGGTSVTISGTNFVPNGNDLEVYFGSTLATSIVSDTASSIVAVSPAESAGTVDVTVVTDGGPSATSSADHFTFVGIATTTTVSPTSTITYGNEVEFFATVSSSPGVGNVGTVTFYDNGVALPGSSTVPVTAGSADFTTTSFLALARIRSRRSTMAAANMRPAPPVRQ